jgi:hypothetical protein
MADDDDVICLSDSEDEITSPTVSFFSFQSIFGVHVVEQNTIYFVIVKFKSPVYLQHL